MKVVGRLYNLCVDVHWKGKNNPKFYSKNGLIYCGFCHKDILRTFFWKEPIYINYRWTENFYKWLTGEQKFTGKYKIIAWEQKHRYISKKYERTPRL